MEFNKRNEKYYEAPKLEIIDCKVQRMLATLSLDGVFDEVGFVGDDPNTFGWGDEVRVN